MSTDSILLREDRDGVAILTLNRPKHFNALSEELLGDLQSALDDIGARKDLRVVVIRASGRGFCAGHDLKELRSQPDQAHYEQVFARSSRLMMTLTTIPQSVIASVRGIATAAGCQLVAACDLAIAEEGARFATSGIDVGLFCSTPAVALSRNVSRKRAFEMLVTGEFIDAATALDYGLVNRVVPADALEAETLSLAEKIAAKSPEALATSKRLFYRQLGMDTEAAYAYAAKVMACDLMSADATEGVDAFIAKRKPVWRR